MSESVAQDMRSQQPTIVTPEAEAIGLAVYNSWLSHNGSVPMELWFGLAVLRGMEARSAGPVHQGLTAKQRALLAFISGFIAEHGYSPSYEEMAKHLGSTKPCCHAIVARLVERGAVRKLPHRSRSLELVAA
jgi:hypothetical protein